MLAMMDEKQLGQARSSPWGHSPYGGPEPARGHPAPTDRHLPGRLLLPLPDGSQSSAPLLSR